MLASVDAGFAQGIKLIDEKSLAHIGEENARRLAIVSHCRIGPLQVQMGICKGSLHWSPNGGPWSVFGEEHTDTALYALCPCGRCVECSLHKSPHATLKTCACAAGICLEGTMWSVEKHRVRQVVEGELRMAMLRGYFYSSPCLITPGVGGTRVVRFKHGCARRVYPDTHDENKSNPYNQSNERWSGL